MPIILPATSACCLELKQTFCKLVTFWCLLKLFKGINCTASQCCTKTRIAEKNVVNQNSSSYDWRMIECNLTTFAKEQMQLTC